MKSLIYTRVALSLFLYSLLSFLPSQINAQSWGFRNGFGSTVGTDRCSGMAIDASGNLYITGSFTGTMDLGTGTLTCVGNLDGFVAKFSPAGVCQWAISFNGPGTAQDQGLGIATNGTSVFVGGVYQTSLSINGAAAITGYGGIDGFGFKLDAATGATQWATVFGSGSTDAVQAMCIDNSGNMYVTGYFSSNATYPTATFGSFTRSSNGGTGTDAYVAKLDGTTGAVTWVSTGGMPSYNDNVSNSGIAYCPTQNAIVMVGSFQAPSAGTTVTYSTTSPVSSVTTTTKGGLDIAVVEMDASTGAFQSVVSVGSPVSTYNEEALAAAYDAASGYVVMTGYFNSGTLTFGTNPPINPIGSDDIFYAAYNPADNSFAWSKAAGSTIQDRGQSINTSGQGSVFITGRYRNTMTAPTASGSLSAVSNRTSSADEIYLLQVNSLTGNAARLLTPVGDNTITTGDIGTGVAARNGKVWLGGMFGGTCSFPPLGTITTSGGTTADILLVRFDGASVLPIKLTSFVAQRTNNDVQLTWKTEAELSTDHFEIERSTDGRNFKNMGRRQATGAAAMYNWTDADALSAGSDYLYYRLKMMSRDGEPTYSSIAKIDITRNGLFNVTASSNPFKGTLVMRVNVPEDATVNFSVADMSGRIISNKAVRLTKGAGNVVLPETANLINGLYLITAEYTGQKIVQKIAKD